MQTPNESSSHVLVSRASERIEAIGGVLIALFAALLAISELVGSNVEDARRQAEVQHLEMSSWYQSKSVKESLQESHLASVELALLASPSANVNRRYADSLVAAIQHDIARYGREKREILEGSAHIPRDQWAQDVGGKMGVIVGVKEWEATAARLNIAESKFDLATLFFQISLVLGAVCIIIYDNPRLQKFFVRGMIACGTVGALCAMYGYALSAR
ncbi:MAG: DUF4337 family protein [Gemmatimonadaceae bacterium]|nr:DUF4337 family protein [Gemmatimonadaceae bacterium]